MEQDAPEATADVAVEKVAADVADNAAAPSPPPLSPAAPSLSSLIARGRVQDGEVLRCVKVREITERREQD